MLFNEYLFFMENFHFYVYKVFVNFLIFDFYVQMFVYYRTLWTDDNDLLTTDFVAAKDDLYVRFTHKRNLAKVCSCFSRFYFNTTLLANAAKMEFYDTGKQEPYVSVDCICEQHC